jgi:hypothetical protein
MKYLCNEHSIQYYPGLKEVWNEAFYKDEIEDDVPDDFIPKYKK